MVQKAGISCRRCAWNMNTAKNEYGGERSGESGWSQSSGLSSGFRRTTEQNRDYGPRNPSGKLRGRLIVFRTICGRLHAHVGCIQRVPVKFITSIIWRNGASPRRQDKWHVGFSKLFFDTPVMTRPTSRWQLSNCITLRWNECEWIDVRKGDSYNRLKFQWKASILIWLSFLKCIILEYFLLFSLYYASHVWKCKVMPTCETLQCVHVGRYFSINFVLYFYRTNIVFGFNRRKTETQNRQRFRAEAAK